MNEKDYALLIKRVAGGDEHAFATLYDATSPLVYGLALRMLGNTAAAEDVTFDAYSRVWAQAPRYDGDGCAPFTWLMMVTRDIALSRLRSGSLDKHEGEPSSIRYSRRATTMARPEGSHEISERRRVVLSLLDALSSEERRVLESAYFSGLNHREIATRLRLSEGAVSGYMRSGLRKLREQLRQPKEHSFALIVAERAM